PPFQGGAAGLFSYELGRSFERLPKPELDHLAFPDLSLGLYDVVVAFDLIERRGFILSMGFPELDPAARDRRAIERGRWFEARLQRAPVAPPAGNISLEGWTSNFTRVGYERMVREVIEKILSGDIFQANVAQRIEAPVPPDFDHFGFYRRLRELNPAPFAAYLDHEDFVIASASPERFLKLEGDRVETRPIKGTRPRFADAILDAFQARALTESRKDRAENVMIVDLLRNDLAKVCLPGSVQVPQLCGLETFASVHHLVSSVVGRLREGQGAADLLAAAFPGGSVTGAPKVRAMEIIAEMEGHARGPYCGAIGYIGFDGTMDTSIVIRTAAFRGGTCVVQAGGGIVTASDPAAEYDETLDKARAMFEAFGAKELAR
ncbi:MAG: aminodeoxychorismate synthase component I, partial [Methylocella sp.]